jgi:hypothetical protein
MGIYHDHRWDRIDGEQYHELMWKTVEVEVVARLSFLREKNDVDTDLSELANANQRFSDDFQPQASRG